MLDLIGFGRIQSDLVGFGWILIFGKFGQFGQTLSHLVGFGRIWLYLVGFGWIWLNSVGFGRIWSDLVRFGRRSPWEGTLKWNACVLVCYSASMKPSLPNHQVG